MTDELTEARAQIAVLREALEAWALPPSSKRCSLMHWFEEELGNWTCGDICDATYEGQGCPSGTCALESGRSAFNAAHEMCDEALAATPSDCYAQIRAEVLEEAAKEFGIEGSWLTSYAVASAIRALKDNP